MSRFSSASANGLRWGAAILLLWGGAFVLACRLDVHPAFRLPQGFGAMDRVFGVARRAFSDSLFEEADNYFHQGVPHIRAKVFSNTWFQVMGEAVRPTLHRHAHGIESREILPWLQFAVGSDPHHVVAYLTTAYWLSTALRRPDLAEQVLIEAQMANPGDYRILFERARIAFRNHDDAKAARLFDAALRLWREEGIVAPEDARADRARILSFRAFLCEVAGETERALNLFQEALRWDPDNQALAERVAAMERGESFVERDRALWEHGWVQDEHEHDHERTDACMRGGLH